MAIISLGTINKKILFAVLGGVFKLIANIILFHSEVKMKSYPCILGINSGIGLCLAIFPFIYIKRRIKRNSGKNSSRIITEQRTFNNIIYSKEKKLKKYIYILIISILDFSQKFISYFYIKYYVENFWIFDSFFLTLFSFLILKTKIYKHHLTSIIIICSIGIILISINSYDVNITFLHVFITLIIEIIFSLENILCKLAVDIKFSFPYEICLYVGILNLLVFSILLIIFTNVPVYGGDDMNTASNDYIDNYFIYINNIDLKEILLFIISLFGRLIFLLFGFITVDYFTPSHIILLLIIGEIAFVFNDEHNWKLYSHFY